MLRPEQGDQRQLQPFGLPDLHQDSRKKAEGRKGISLKAIPTLEHGVGARRLRVHHRREVDRQPVIEGGRKEVNGGWPEAKKLAKRLRTESPLRTDDLVPATQRVGEDVHLARDELRKKLDVEILAKAEG